MVESSPSDISLIGRRVVGEINCRCGPCDDPDPIFIRNHAPERVVLGIIAKDGALAEYLTMPVETLHVVDDDIDDATAAFAEPLAAACRVVEQGVVGQGQSVAVVGDGKLGILIAHVLVASGHKVTFVGHHERKLKLVPGVERVVVTSSSSSSSSSTEGGDLVGKFDVVVEASGASNGINAALAMVRPLGTLVLKSTCAVVDSSSSSGGVPLWAPIANDVVVAEKKVVGSRCGPFPPALELLKQEATKTLVMAMLDAALPLSQGCDAIAAAQRKGAMKVQVIMGQ